MQPKSPLDNLENTSLSITVRVNGSPIKDEYGIITIKVVHAINKISYAEVVFDAGVNMESGEIPISDRDEFCPGNIISIAAGYNGSGEQNIFSGLIVNHSLEINPETNFTLKILCKHAAVGMTYNKTAATFFNKSDSDIISAIVSNYGLNVSVDNTVQQQEAVFQRMATDWDLILSRCNNNGFVVCMDEEKMRIGKPVINGAAVLRIATGESIISFEADISAAYQPTSITATAWDAKTQALVSATASEPVLNTQGNITAKALSGKLGQKELNLTTTAPLNKDELQTRANAALLCKRLSATRGKVTFIGNAAVKTGNLVELSGVGKKFNGNAFVAGVMHSIEAGTWKTTVSFGLEYSSVSTEDVFSLALPTGQMPAIQGLQIATVKKISGDTESGYRVLVKIASNRDSDPGTWARMASFYATSSAGAVFWPEVGDEVILGFLESDPRFPVILGSLFSEKNQPPDTVNDENNYIKSLTTRSKMQLSFDEQKKCITITTPGNNSITISDEDKEINITDQNNNSIKLSTDGIILNSARDILLKASGNIMLDATDKISIGAAQDVAISGLNVTNEAKIGFTGKGSATAEISASGQTTVKGAIVMIN